MPTFNVYEMRESGKYTKLIASHATAQAALDDCEDRNAAERDANGGHLDAGIFYQTDVAENVVDMVDIGDALLPWLENSYDAQCADIGNADAEEAIADMLSLFGLGKYETLSLDGQTARAYFYKSK